ncbi:RagB/SusD family nutrient uptake outer membrane protein [Sphingobacterium endophyticum]|uniref:RagB/SusD family nutrient uptake outer membrane protein n=1 Tax=Sphingobacterium endophyticum TaxID=2546448 RepID=UPI0012E1C6DB|nr:RagB/SusD family nutrient uptake outer membrane protein [Sphingobacterium endophyticum]
MIKYKKIKMAMLLAAATLSMNGCNDDFFDAQPDNLLNIETIFSNRAQTENYWGGLYSPIPDVWDQPYTYFWSAITDEIDVSNWQEFPANSGALSADNVNTMYVNYYNKIRQCQIFIDNVDKCTELLTAENGSTLVKEYKAEAKFLRAFYYWSVMKMHGPVVILPLNSDDAAGENYQIPRSSWDESVEFVLAQIDEALKDLPAEHFLMGTTTVDGTQLGRINKMVAEAVKSEILLFHASPLYNGNTSMSNWRNYDGKQLINPTYDPSKWQKAAAQAKAAIDIAEANGKALYVKNGSSEFETAYLSTRDVFWDGYQKEGIWLRPSTNRHQWEIHASPRAISGTAYNGLAVVQELVDDFRMENGQSIQQSSSYNENTYSQQETRYYAEGTNKMYTDREPRFYSYITFNGSLIPGAPKSGMKWVEFFATGNSGKNGAPRDWPKTGYTARKNIHPSFSVNPSNATNRAAMLIRLSELYLNYAEALNESQPNSPNILTYLNKVRTRAGLPALSPGLSQSRMREEIRLERRVELCFEGKRFFDVRRWKLADQEGYKQGGNYTGMDMTKGSAINSPDFHKRVPAVLRAQWEDKNYFMPWHQMEIDRNKQLVQIPGY